MSKLDSSFASQRMRCGAMATLRKVMGAPMVCKQDAKLKTIVCASSSFASAPDALIVKAGGTGPGRRDEIGRAHV